MGLRLAYRRRWLAPFGASVTYNHRMQPTYLPSLRCGKSAADARRWADRTHPSPM
jgi:hypothetical protein